MRPEVIIKHRVNYPTPGGLPGAVRPFASVNVEKDDETNEITVIAQILMERIVNKEGKEVEGAAFGPALDGSASMIDLYGVGGGPFGGSPNYFEPVAKSILKYLAGFSGSGTVEMAYWAVGSGGKEIEGIGAIDEGQADSLKIQPTKKMGLGSYLNFTKTSFKVHPGLWLL